MFEIHKGKTRWVGSHPNLEIFFRDDARASETKEECTSLIDPYFEKIFSMSRRDVRGFNGETCTR